MVGVSAHGPRRLAGRSDAELIIACDGRHSTLREAAGFEVVERRRADGRAVAAPVQARRAIPDRRSAASMPGASSSCWIATITGSAPSSSRRAASTTCTRLGSMHSAPRSCGSRLSSGTGCRNSRSWDDVKLLTVAVNRLDTWYRPGLLFIGDAAHAMSPVGGVGINLAIQDAVATANILVPAYDDRAPRRWMIFAPCSAGANGRHA